MNVAAWLRDLGLERYEPAFRANDVDADVLPELTEADLERLGVASLGHRKKLLKSIAALRGGSASPTLAAGQRSEPRGEEAGPVETGRAERRQLTVMFVDLVGSTALSARLDPEALRDVVGSYQRVVAETVGRYGGFVAKCMGDGVLIYFGYPRAHEDDAERAVRAGLALVPAIGGLDAVGSTAVTEPLQVRVGIATGPVVVGDLISLGGGVRERDAAVGEAPNLAFRLQALAAPGAVVIAEGTHRLTGGLFRYADLGARPLKGWTDPVRAWRALGEGTAEGRFEALHGAGAGSSLTPFVGRERELARLLDLWRQAKAGEGRVVLLSGEPGIGKSRLIQTARERLAAEPHVQVHCHCSPQHRNTALHPIIAQLERAAGFGQDDAASVRLDKLERLLAPCAEDSVALVPLIANLLSLSTEGRHPPLALTPQRQKELTLEALVDQLRGLAAHRPVLLVLEDAHWADPTTLELMNRLIDHIPKLPVLALVTFRPEFRPPWVGAARVSALTLDRLTRRQARALALRVTGGKALPAKVLGQIVAKTDGVPLFVEELTRTVLESGLLRDAGDHGYVLTGPLPPLAIPSTLHDSLMARLDRSAPMREVAQIGAVIGRAFAHELLAAVAPMEVRALDRALAELVASELVSRHGTPSHAVYAFKHALVQDAAYQSLLKSRRQPLHARIADALEQRFPDTAEAQPELLARHLTEAGLPERAIGYWRRAGEHALARSGTTEALAHIDSGLVALEGLPQGAERQRLEIDLRLALGETLRAAKGTAAPETEVAFRRAREVCEQSGDGVRLMQALYGLALCHYTRADLAVAHATGSEFLARAERGGDPVALLQANETLGYASFALGRPTAAWSHLETATALAQILRRGADPLPPLVERQIPSTLVYLSWSLWILGYPDQASRRCREGLELAVRSPDPFAAAMGIGNAATFHQLGRDAASARREAERLIALARAKGIPYWTAIGELIRGWALAEEGQVDAGLVVMRRVSPDLRFGGYRIQVPHELALQAEVCGKAGRIHEALALLGEAQETVERTGERSLEAELHRMKAELLLARGAGDDAEAERSLGQALAVARAQNARMWELRAARSLARLWRDRGRHAEARDLLAPVHGRFTEGFGTPDLIEAKELLAALWKRS